MPTLPEPAAGTLLAMARKPGAVELVYLEPQGSKGTLRMLALFFILLVALIAAFGFWDTLAAIFGAAFLLILVIVLGIAALGLAGYLFLKRSRDG